MHYAMRIADHPGRTNEHLANKTMRTMAALAVARPTAREIPGSSKKNENSGCESEARLNENEANLLFPTKPYDRSTVTRPSAKRARKRRCACEIGPLGLS
ncbi:hypothetical protein SUVC_08G0550 [Saccharomyces uvarum]|uniref:Uncharacterized protein n=1 Tax=Saccharomyces uvarum TaxID=230603 RepID=A0AA35NRC2_SACUV|nr:hypothetical protein SUVC_08G0550 [Saccharomyces uvarum]